MGLSSVAINNKPATLPTLSPSTRYRHKRLVVLATKCGSRNVFSQRVSTEINVDEIDW